MTDPATGVAIVGVGAILPDARDAGAFWQNVKQGRYSISEVDAERWDPELYFDPDPKAPERTYSKIGGWVRDWDWDPLGWRLPIPPRVADAMDDSHKWALACGRMALLDAGWPERELDLERTAVVLGNAMSGEHHYQTSMRIAWPELARELDRAESYAALPEDVRAAIAREVHGNIDGWLPPVTEDTMPGELGNCMAGRVANLFNLRGPNFVVDAACASALAAMDASIEGLVEREYDAVLTGGIDRNMGAHTFVKFCAIGALSATGTRPYADGADGFVMGEGAAMFLLKRLDDAERDGDRIYAVIRGIAGSSDGKGKGITAPNPVGQKLAVERAWRKAGIDPSVCSLVEGHGTSTRVGDVVEVTSLGEAFAGAGLAPGSVALGSVKSNIGHLKGAAGAAGILKTALALHEKVLPPSLNFERPNPNVDWSSTPFAVNTELREWEPANGGARVAGVSAFGFGGTNFHVVLEEHVPGRNGGGSHTQIAVPSEVPAGAPKAPLRGALVIGADDDAGLEAALRAAQDAGDAPPFAPPEEASLRAPERVAIDYGDAAELAEKAGQALKALASGNPAAWKALRGRGIFRGSGPAPKVAFLYTGQGSQYAGMLAELRRTEPIVAETFDEADGIMRPLLDGRNLSDIIFVDLADEAAVAEANAELMRTEITQPAVLTVDTALTRLLAAYGIRPDFVMGHSLGEYGALIASGSLGFAEALEAVSARGREMAGLNPADPGAMAAVMAPLAEVEQVMAAVDGYAVIANVNSTSQVVIGGATEPVKEAAARLEQAGHKAVLLPVSHAFHTEIVAGASEPLRAVLRRLRISPPEIPVVANVSGDFYPKGPGVEEEMIDILGRQVASPVQFVRGLHTLFEAGARVFVETGPKRALQGFASDVLGDDEALNLFANHPKNGDLPSFNQALCGLYASGLGAGRASERPEPVRAPSAAAPAAPPPAAAGPVGDDTLRDLGRMFVDFLERGRELVSGGDRGGLADTDPVVITGASLGLPGTDRTFDDANVARILHGEQLIDVIPTALRHEILERHITRLVKGDDGGASFETIDSAADVIKLAARAGALDVAEEFGVDAERVPALGRETQLAIAAGIDALRDAGIPLVLHYKDTTTGSRLPDRWTLPDEMRDDTGVIFASAFPGLDDFAEEMNHFWADRVRSERIDALESLRARIAESEGDHSVALAEIDRRLHDLRLEREREPYTFDRRFLFRVLSMGHSQLAELIGARGPNTQVNAACASTTQAVAIAEDWIRTGRCRRVVIVAADDATSDVMFPWVGSGFLASGAAATDEDVEQAATPFDRRRHGMIVGMGAAGVVVESAAAARERGVGPICEVLGAVTANSAFHGTRLDVGHIGQVMEEVVSQAEARGVSRREIAPETVFVSHETYTPARGGSAAAEIHALREVFGDQADRVVIANTKGFTGHPMGVGIEDVVAIKSLETGLVPPVPNFHEVDPDLGALNLSKGGAYPVRYALRLAAGFGSQISMMLLRWTPARDGRRRNPEELGFGYRVADPETWKGWLRRISRQDQPELEVDRRRLRVVDRGPAAAPAARAEHPTAAVPLGAPDAPAAAAPEPAAAPAAEPAPVAAPAPAPAAPAGDDVSGRILELVAEQTGYPSDLLDLDLDLEADLGIDTVKQAEVFAAIRESYGIERDDSLKLRDYPTLTHVVEFVRERADVPAPAAEPVAAAVTEAAPSGTDGVETRILELVAEQTGYPSDLLDLDLDLEADLGIDTVKQAEVFAAIRESYGIERDDSLKLRDYPTLTHVVGFVRERAGIAEPAAEPAAAPAAPAEPPAEAGGIEQRVLAIVGEQTGYPADMLATDLDLEADLGIDTVKQAEVFATIRESYSIERDDSLKLRDYPTLDHVVEFVRERAAGEAAAEAPAPEAPAADEPAGAAAEPDGFPRRVPQPVVRPPLDVCVDTGVTLGEGSRVVVMPDQGGVGKALAKRLATLGAEVLTIAGAPEVEELERQIEDWKAAGPIQGVYWLPALDDEGELGSLEPSDWRPALHARVKLLAATMRALADDGEGTFLVSATRLGGRHGYDRDGATSVLGGAVSGFTKALAREREQVLVKAVDFAASRKKAALADVLIDETLRDPGAVEIGYADDLRWSVALVERGAEPDPERRLTADTVFVVTGGAGSIVSAITADLAAASGGTFHLLDLVPEPDTGDPDLERFDSDPDGLKRDLADRIKEAGERPTPKLVERELARIERARAAREALEAIRAAGGTAHWHQCDLTDPDAVEQALADVRAGGRVDVLMHCAGLEISHFLPDKPQREYDLVFDVKVEGWLSLLRALRGTRIGSAVVFSSIAGRFGNAGQTDYSAANDLLCKSISNLRRTSPGTHGVAVDWTAWASIGMASRGSIPKMMEIAGIDMLPPEVGIPVVRREITAAGPGGEVLVGGALGVLLEERHPTGGIDPDAASQKVAAPPGPMTGRIASMSLNDGLTVHTELDPARQAFLDDHRIDGTPVLPGVMGMEGFAEAARALLPGWHVIALEDVDLRAPFKFYRDEPRTLELRALLRDAGDGTVVADCRLIGRRTLPGKGEQETVHFTGRARLSPAPPPAPPEGERPGTEAHEAEVDREAVYRVYFHGPAYQVLDRAWREDGDVLGRLAPDLPPAHEPPGQPTEIAPRLVELCFQTAGVWELGKFGRMGLPTHVDRVVRFEGADEGGPLVAVVHPGDGDGVNAEVVDEAGRVVVRLEGYRTTALPGGLDPEALDPIRAAMD
ncbi:MAG TPA: SDR family NAD(P)-dependent oxidoreductase [Thermoleophilaceae bacterium]